MNKEFYARLREISKRLKEEYHAQEVILFGSYATGKATKDSDVDLFIIAWFFERMATVKRLIRDLRNGFPVSTIVLTLMELEKRKKAGDQFVRHI